MKINPAILCIRETLLQYVSLVCHRSLDSHAPAALSFEIT